MFNREKNRPPEALPPEPLRGNDYDPSVAAPFNAAKNNIPPTPDSVRDEQANIDKLLDDLRDVVANPAGDRNMPNQDPATRKADILAKLEKAAFTGNTTEILTRLEDEIYQGKSGQAAAERIANDRHRSAQTAENRAQDYAREARDHTRTSARYRRRFAPQVGDTPAVAAARRQHYKPVEQQLNATRGRAAKTEFEARKALDQAGRAGRQANKMTHFQDMEHPVANMVTLHEARIDAVDIADSESERRLNRIPLFEGTVPPQDIRDAEAQMLDRKDKLDELSQHDPERLIRVRDGNINFFRLQQRVINQRTHYASPNQDPLSATMNPRFNQDGSIRVNSGTDGVVDYYPDGTTAKVEDDGSGNAVLVRRNAGGEVCDDLPQLIPVEYEGKKKPGQQNLPDLINRWDYSRSDQDASLLHHELEFHIDARQQKEQQIIKAGNQVQQQMAEAWQQGDQAAFNALQAQEQQLLQDLARERSLINSMTYKDEFIKPGVPINHDGTIDVRTKLNGVEGDWQLFPDGRAGLEVSPADPVTGAPAICQYFDRYGRASHTGPRR